ncbi:MAG: hypothetical protein DRP56_06090 [Planctomycetota bacterium]|nr:MAG: hypothetical protein DRP56_06090 [Planctomycetota bacterium]
MSVADKIKICFVSPKAYPVFNPKVKGTIGGAEIDFYYLSTELAKDDRFDISIVVADYGQEDHELIENVKVIKGGKFKGSVLWNTYKFWAAFRKASSDIYLIKSISWGIFLLGLFCLKNRKEFVYRTAHSSHCDGAYIKRNPIKGWLFKKVIRNAKIVFTQNKSDQSDLLRTARVKSIYIPNGHRATKAKTSLRDEILWVGRSAAFKNPELFLRLAESYKNEKFVMICQKATGDRSFLSLVEKASRLDNLEFIEGVSFDKIEHYFAKAKVFINTSDSEGFPNTFIQACKHGVPILSTNVNPDGFLDKYKCGICADGDHSRVAEALRDLLVKDEYCGYGENARWYFEGNHDVKKIIEEYKKIFVKSMSEEKE